MSTPTAITWLQYYAPHRTPSARGYQTYPQTDDSLIRPLPQQEVLKKCALIDYDLSCSLSQQNRNAMHKKGIAIWFKLTRPTVPMLLHVRINIIRKVPQAVDECFLETGGRRGGTGGGRCLPPFSPILSFTQVFLENLLKYVFHSSIFTFTQV